MEQDNIFRQFDFKGQYSNYTGLVYTGTNQYNGTLLAGKPLPMLFCPSSPLKPFVLEGSIAGTGAGVQSPTYTGIAGAIDSRTALNRDGETYEHFGKGITSRGGALVSHETVKLVGISDGTSNTILVGEQSDHCRDAAGARLDCRSDFGHAFAMGPGWIGENRHWNVTSVRYRINDKNWSNKGVGDTYYGQNRPLQSAHSGGINVVFGDSSVRFLSDSLPLQTLYNLSNRDDGNVVANF